MLRSAIDFDKLVKLPIDDFVGDLQEDIRRGKYVIGDGTYEDKEEVRGKKQEKSRARRKMYFFMLQLLGYLCQLKSELSDVDRLHHRMEVTLLGMQSKVPHLNSRKELRY